MSPDGYNSHDDASHTAVDGRDVCFRADEGRMFRGEVIPFRTVLERGAEPPKRE